MYYRKWRKKSSSSHTKPIIDVPINDVWESFQEEKTYLDFGISEEAYQFLSDREKCNRIREINQYWNDKKARLEKFGYRSYITWVLAMVFGLFCKFVFNDNNPSLVSNVPDIVSYVFLLLFGIPFLINFIILLPIHLISRKIVYAYDEFERDYKRYVEYHKRYESKKNQYVNHIKELEDFKNDKEKSFLNSIAEQLKKVQGRTYRTEDDWRQMTDREFEIEVGKVYSRLGYETTVTKQSGDGGVDVIAKKDGEIIYIQCKHYGKKTHLGAPELQGFWGCCSGNGVKRGIMVCTSTLTKDARLFANKLKGQLEIVGMKELLELDKSFYYSHPTNAEKSFTDSFKTFILNNHFIDCYLLWLLSEVFYNEDDAKDRMAKLNKWKGHSYIAKDIIVNLTNKIKVYVVLLVPDYLLKEIQETRLSY